MLDIREFEDMVDDTCQRIVDSEVGITNVGVGSVTRTLVEAIVSEIDVLQYTTLQAYLSKTIDNAEGEDLDDVVSILGVTRGQAEYCTGTVTFSVTEESDVDIEIPAESIVSTVQTQNGTIYEFATINDAILPAGELEIDVDVICTSAGKIHISPGNVTVISTSILDIAEVTNKNAIYGGEDEETDEELRDRAKDALSSLGKGTMSSIRRAVLDVDGVADVSVYDMRSGVGTVDIFVVGNIMPISDSIRKNILDAIEQSKSAGIKAYLKFPDIQYLDVDFNITSDIEYDVQTIGSIVFEYINNIGIGNRLILNQLRKIILENINDDKADIEFNKPTSNVNIDVDKIFSVNSIIINGVTYYERNNQ